MIFYTKKGLYTASTAPTFSSRSTCTPHRRQAATSSRRLIYIPHHRQAATCSGLRLPRRGAPQGLILAVATKASREAAFEAGGAGLSQATSAGAFFAPRTEPETTPRRRTAPTTLLLYSERRASTGSLLLAELAGMRPATRVSTTEMPMRIRALAHGRLMMLGTWWVSST